MKFKHGLWYGRSRRFSLSTERSGETFAVGWLWVAMVMLASFGICPSSEAAPVGTAISYQGRLNDGGAAATGNYEFRFTLHDAPTAGTQIGPTRTNAPVDVVGGEFNDPIDFGPGAFNGEARWLEIAVRSSGSGVAFTTLAPRQSFSPVPYALRALEDSRNRDGASLTNIPFSSLTGTLDPSRIAVGSLPASVFSDGALTGNQIGNGTIRSDHLSPSLLENLAGSKLGMGSVTLSNLQTSSVRSVPLAPRDWPAPMEPRAPRATLASQAPSVPLASLASKDSPASTAPMAPSVRSVPWDPKASPAPPTVGAGPAMLAPPRASTSSAPPTIGRSSFVPRIAGA